jgi:hypothetical protein
VRTQSDVVQRHRVVSSLSIDSNGGSGDGEHHDASAALPTASAPPLAPSAGAEEEEEEVFLRRPRGHSKFQQSANVGTGRGVVPNSTAQGAPSVQGVAGGMTPNDDELGVVVLATAGESESKSEGDDEAKQSGGSTGAASLAGTLSAVLKAKKAMKSLKAKRLIREPQGVVVMWSRVRCGDCDYCLLDEEVMAGWSDDSACLVVNCPVCGFLVVPKLNFLAVRNGKHEPESTR